MVTVCIVRLVYTVTCILTSVIPCVR